MWLKLLCLLVGISYYTCFFSIPTAEAQSRCELKILEAQRLYDRGYAKNSIEQILYEDCPPTELIDREQKALAYQLLARSYVVIDHPDSARQWVKKLVIADNSFVPNPELDPLAFQRLVNRERERFRTYGWFFHGRRSHHWLGRGAIATGIGYGIYLLLRPGDKPLVGPPDLPPTPLQ